MTDENYFDVGVQHGGVPITCRCAAAGRTDAAWFDDDPDSPTFGVTPLRVNAFHDVAVAANVEEHFDRPELSRVMMLFYGPPGCTHGAHLSAEDARRLAAQLLDAADGVEQLRAMGTDS
jgi:hypothetical protein